MVLLICSETILLSYMSYKIFLICFRKYFMYNLFGAKYWSKTENILKEVPHQFDNKSHMSRIDPK